MQDSMLARDTVTNTAAFKHNVLSLSGLSEQDTVLINELHQDIKCFALFEQRWATVAVSTRAELRYLASDLA